MVDFADFDSKAAAERGTVLELISPATKKTWLDDEKKPYWIKLLGMDSEKLRKIANKIVDRTVNEIRRNQQSEFDSEEATVEKVKLYAIATIEWHIPPVDGEKLDCNEKNARKLYSDVRFPWVVEQIDKAINDRASFFEQASPTS